MTFILFFNVNAFTIQKVGMVITSVFQKLSLVFPVIAGILIFSESAELFKVVAILLAVASIILINVPAEKDPERAAQAKRYWYWPFVVLFGSGLIEVVLFYAEQTGKVVNAGVDFVTILFLLAGCWGFLFLVFTGKIKEYTVRDLIAGVLVGIPNFFTIYLIIKGLEIGWEGSVLFPLNNIGVIILTALVGVGFFKEKMNYLNYTGLALAMLSVVLISL